MELTATELRSKEDLKTLSNICEPLVLFFPNLNYFLDYSEILNGGSRHFSFSDGAQIVLIGELREGRILCNPKAFINVLYVANLNMDVKEYMKFILAHLHDIGIRAIRIRQTPHFIAKPIRFSLNSDIIERCKTSVIDLSNFKPSSRRNKSRLKCEKQGFLFQEVDSHQSLETWSYLESFLISRNLPSLGFDRIDFLLRNYRDAFKLVRVIDPEGNLVAAALLNRIGDAIRIPNYCGSRDASGATDFLIFGVTDMAYENNIQFVDLGISVDPISGIEVAGIVNYKSEFSAVRFSIQDEIVNLINH